MFIEKKKIGITPFKIFLSTCGIFYVWFLPILSVIGFAEPNSTSISEFIANPPATGAMSAISFMPLTIMWEYQDFIITKQSPGYNGLYYSISLFQFFYGCFLICTESYAPLWLHATTVVLFGLGFIIHSVMILIYIETSKLARISLVIGILAFTSLLVVEGMWFWAMECVGFTSLLLFTPIEWYNMKIENDLNILLSENTL